MTKATIIAKKGAVAAVGWIDGRDWRGAIIPTHYTEEHRIGDKIEIPLDILNDGLDYGIWFDLLIPDEGFTILPDMLQNAMRGHGIWTYEDLIQKPREAQAAILSLVNLVYGQLVHRAKEHYGGTS